MDEREPGSEVGEGAFRRAPVHEICTCGELASKRCVRCEVPLCRAHAPAIAHRCADCEDAYASFLRDRKIHPLTALQVFLSYGVGIGAVVGAACLIEWLGWGESRRFLFFSVKDLLMLLVAIPACLLPLIGIHWRRIRLRTRFLAERPARRRLRISASALRAEKATRDPVPRPKPKPTVGNSFATASLILNLIFFFPGLPLVGLTLALIAFLGRRRFQTSDGSAKVAIAALVVGLASAGVQVYAMVQMARGHW